MALLLVGISHNTAHISLREKVAFPPEVIADALQAVHGRPEVDEVVIVSTCNRTELYLSTVPHPDQPQTPAAADGTDAPPQVDTDAPLPPDADTDVPPQSGADATPPPDAETAQRSLVDWLAAYHGLNADELHKSSYSLKDEEVVRHLMQVACGLDSMVLGEPQILGQIKSAYAVSQDLGVVGSRLNRAFQSTFAIAKQVRTDTAIGENPVSVASAAVMLAERIFSRLERLQILLIGAGQTIELAATHLMARGVRHLVVANRTLDNALELAGRIKQAAGAEVHGVLLSDIPAQLETTDIVISSTNSQLPLLGKGAVGRALKQRRRKPMLLIDLAVPRDIEPEVSELDDAYLYSVDDISGVIEDGVKSRTEAAAQARRIIDQGVTDYLRRHRALNAVDTLTAFRHKADGIRLKELERARKSLQQGDDPQAVLEALAHGITRKLLHSPSVRLKQASAEGREDLLQLINELYELQQADKDK